MKVINEAVVAILLFMALVGFVVSLKSIEMHEVGIHNIDLSMNMAAIASDNGWNFRQMSDKTNYGSILYTDLYSIGLDQVINSTYSLLSGSIVFMFSIMTLYYMVGRKDL